MSQRRDWTFIYTVEEVANAAEAKAKYHAEREAFWEREKEEVVAAIRESGLEVRGHKVTGGERAEVVLDPTLAKRLDECQNKLTGHQSSGEEYRGWHSVLRVAVEREEDRLELDHEDVRYFGLDTA